MDLTRKVASPPVPLDSTCASYSIWFDIFIYFRHEIFWKFIFSRFFQGRHVCMCGIVLKTKQFHSTNLGYWYSNIAFQLHSMIALHLCYLHIYVSQLSIVYTCLHINDSNTYLISLMQLVQLIQSIHSIQKSNPIQKCHVIPERHANVLFYVLCEFYLKQLFYLLHTLFLHQLLP